jgi:hypothetical protein
MDFYYYIKSDLVIEYKDQMGRKCEIQTDMKIQRGHMEHDGAYDLEDLENKYSKVIEKLKKELEKNTYKIILFENDQWLDETYKKEYEKYILREFKEIKKFIKIYKKFTALERT